MESEKQGTQTHAETETLYEQLPRFVDGITVETEDVKLQPVERSVQLDGRQFDFIILPASIIAKIGDDGEIDEQRRLPGDFEEFLESVLRALAVPENPNFDATKSLLWCGHDQLIFGMSDFEDENGEKADLTGNRIEVALSTLASVEYILKRETSEFYFSAVQHLRQTELDGKIYYRLSFTSFFFNDRDELFEHLFAEQND